MIDKIYRVQSYYNEWKYWIVIKEDSTNNIVRHEVSIQEYYKITLNTKTTFNASYNDNNY